VTDLERKMVLDHTFVPGVVWEVLFGSELERHLDSVATTTSSVTSSSVTSLHTSLSAIHGVLVCVIK